LNSEEIGRWGDREIGRLTHPELDPLTPDELSGRLVLRRALVGHSLHVTLANPPSQKCRPYLPISPSPHPSGQRA